MAETGGTPTEVSQVRAFNRIVSERIGALEDRYLARGRPLGHSRVLWEVGHDDIGVADLRARLGLDSGYVSRILRSLEAEDLVETHADKADRRARRVALTERGRHEWASLDAGGDQVAEAMLDPLDGRQRRTLAEATATVERLLAVGQVTLTVEDPATPSAQLCLGSYLEELDARFAAGFDPARSISAEADELRPPAGLLIVATRRGEPVGCGALKLHERQPAEIKRMWVAPTARGIGLGRRLLAALEEQALKAGAETVQLETNQSLREAILLYRSAGYHEVSAFNDEPYAHHWFSKQLAPAEPGTP